MAFMFAGTVSGVKPYKRKDGSQGAILQFVENALDGSIKLTEFTVPPHVDASQFEAGKPTSFSVEVAGKDAYYKIVALNGK